MTVRILSLAFVFVGGLAGVAAAHDRTVSYSSWEIEGREARVELRLAALDVSRFAVVDGEVATRLRLSAGEAACAPVDRPRRMQAEEGMVVLAWRIRCPESGTLEIRDDLLFDRAPTHLHFARVTRDGSSPLERVLTDHERRWSLEGAESPVGTSFRGYVLLGVEHIGSGYDHLAFLLALLLVAASLREVAGVVTGFTVAHSITLAAAVLGRVRPAAASIEALIGLSIALVAIENLWLADRRRAVPVITAGGLGALALAAALGLGQVPALTLAGLSLFSLCYFALLGRSSAPRRLRWAVAFLFGLLHGFGFAAAVTAARLPTERLVHALCGFNVGVELGQLGVVLAVWPFLRRVDRSLAADYGSAAVLALGVFWFVTRAYG